MQAKRYSCELRDIKRTTREIKEKNSALAKQYEEYQQPNDKQLNEQTS